MKHLLLLLIYTAIVIESRSSYSCTSPDCRDFVDSIKSSVNIHADPCVDFSEYACGHWHRNNPIPSDRHQWTVIHILQKHRTEKLLGVLNGTVPPLNPTKSYNKVKRMYDSCMNSEAIESSGVEIILAELRKNGGWPAMMALDDWRPGAGLVNKILEDDAKTLDLSLFYKIKVHPRVLNPTVNYLWISALAHVENFLTRNPRNSPKLLQYIGNITETVKILAASSNTTVNMENVERDVANLVDFQIDLARIIAATKQNAAKQPRSMTIDNLQNWFNNHSHTDNSKVIWMGVLGSMFGDTGIQLSEDDVVLVRGFSYMIKLVKLLDATPLRTIVNYMQWRFVEKMMPYGPKNLRNIAERLQDLKHPSKLEKDRANMCLLSLGLMDALSYEYVKLYFPRETKNLVNNIVNNILNASSQVMGETSWLPSDERQFINEKLNAVKFNIGYPDWYDRPSAIDDYFEKWSITDNFMENILEINKLKRKVLLSKLKKPVDKNEFTAYSIDIAGDYDDRANVIKLTAAFLQSPIFPRDVPRVLQYATLGNIIGHELAHAFDDSGIKFDKNGKKAAWQSIQSTIQFSSKVQCFIDQYNQYKIFDAKNHTLYINGETTRNENIADLHGLRFAYRGYESIKTSEDENLKLPGLESYTDKQLFFLGYANVLCSSMKSHYRQGMTSEAAGVTPKHRIIGTLSNMEEFSAAFNCPSDAPMNPRNKCAIWGTN